jgi:hypothetical protein
MLNDARRHPGNSTFSFKGNLHANYFLFMSRYRMSIIFLGMALCTFGGGAFGQDDSVRSVFARRTVFLGPLLAYNARDASIDFNEIQKSVPVHRSGILALGLAGGIRIPVSRAARFQVGLNIDGGGVTDDTLFTAETVTVRNYYYHAGLEPQIHVAPWQTRKIAPYAFAGIGANCVWVQEHTFLLDNPAQEILYTDRAYISEFSVSFDVVGGVGCDIALNKKFGLFLNDCFRYLYPVTYKIKQDFPLYDMPYHETLYGNVFSAGISMKLR